MTKPLPKWIMQRYSILWNRFHEKEFDYDGASKILKKDIMLSITLSSLKKAGWLELRLDVDDARKRIYRLKNPEQCVKEMAGMKW